MNDVSAPSRVSILPSWVNGPESPTIGVKPSAAPSNNQQVQAPIARHERLLGRAPQRDKQLLWLALASGPAAASGEVGCDSRKFRVRQEPYDFPGLLSTLMRSPTAKPILINFLSLWQDKRITLLSVPAEQRARVADGVLRNQLGETFFARSSAENDVLMFDPTAPLGMQLITAIHEIAHLMEPGGRERFAMANAAIARAQTAARDAIAEASRRTKKTTVTMADLDPRKVTELAALQHDAQVKSQGFRYYSEKYAYAVHTRVVQELAAGDACFKQWMEEQGRLDQITGRGLTSSQNLTMHKLDAKLVEEYARTNGLSFP